MPRTATAPTTPAPAPAFRFIDLFAGIGGFAAALRAFGGESVYSVEIDKDAANIYELNWGHNPLGDITKDANDDVMNVPDHDVLAAGFPCQPFSKSGAQKGMDEVRGTLFFNIMKIVEAHHPKIVLLENVRNLAGPRHAHEWQVIIERLRAEGYHVSETPAVFSPHLLPLEMGGRPQVRERVFITATYDPDHIGDEFNPRPPVTHRDLRDGEEWDLEADLPLNDDHDVAGCNLSESETAWIDAWDEWVQLMWTIHKAEAKAADATTVRRLPGFPVWVDAWKALDHAEVGEAPAWKANFLRKNAALYAAHKPEFDRWLAKHDVLSFPPSRRKLEWQAQDTPTLWECVMQMRPSGIRAKRPTHLPALVAITQTSIVGARERRLTPIEATRLQGLPDNFTFGDQRPSLTYKQLGNGVNVGAVWHVMREHVRRDEAILKLDPTGQSIFNAVAVDAPKSPDDVLFDVVAQSHAARA